MSKEKNSKKDKKTKKEEEKPTLKLSPKRKEKEEREDFRKFFIKIKKQFNLDKALEEVIWLHLKATGCNVEAKFAEGVKSFGYKI